MSAYLQLPGSLVFIYQTLYFFPSLLHYLAMSLLCFLGVVACHIQHMLVTNYTLHCSAVILLICFLVKEQY